MQHNNNYLNNFFPLPREENIPEKRKTVIIVGGGILGLSTACKLTHEYEVTLVNDTPLDKTNSACALYGTGYIPSPKENKELYQLCKESYPGLADLTSIEGSGCTVIPVIQYFARKAEQDEAIATNESVKLGCTSIIDLNDKTYYQDKDFPYRVRLETIAIDFKALLKNLATGGDIRYFIRMSEACYLGTTLEPGNGNNFTEEEKITSAEKVFKNLKGPISEDVLKALWLSEQKEISGGVRSRRKIAMPMLKQVEGTNIIVAYGCGGSTYAAFPAVSEQISRVTHRVVNENKASWKNEKIRSKL